MNWKNKILNVDLAFDVIEIDNKWEAHIRRIGSNQIEWIQRYDEKPNEKTVEVEWENNILKKRSEKAL